MIKRDGTVLEELQGESRWNFTWETLEETVMTTRHHISVDHPESTSL